MFYFSYFKDSAIITVWVIPNTRIYVWLMASLVTYCFFFTFLLKKKEKVTVIYSLEERFEEEIPQCKQKYFDSFTVTYNWHFV